MCCILVVTCCILAVTCCILAVTIVFLLSRVVFLLSRVVFLLSRVLYFPPWVGMWSVIVVFPGHTHLILGHCKFIKTVFGQIVYPYNLNEITTCHFYTVIVKYWRDER